LLQDVVTRVAQGNGDKGLLKDVVAKGLLKDVVTKDCSIVVTRVAPGCGDKGLLNSGGKGCSRMW
jgi:hypothetical protein